MKKMITLLLILSCQLVQAKCDEMGRLDLINTTGTALRFSKITPFEDSSIKGVAVKDALDSHKELELIACKPNGLLAKKTASGEIELESETHETIALAYEYFPDHNHDGQVDVSIKVRLSNSKEYQVRINKLRDWDNFKPIAEVVIESYTLKANDAIDLLVPTDTSKKDAADDT